MSVHKSDRAAVKKLIAQNKRYLASKKRLVGRVLKLKSAAQKLELEAAGILTTVDELERSISMNEASIRGYSYGG